MAAQQRDPVLVAIARLETKVENLCQRVSDHEKKLRWVIAAATLVVGAVGGPDAVAIISGGPA